MAKLTATGYVPVTSPTYTLQGNDIPFVLAHFDHQSRMLRMEIFEAATGKSWHRAFTQNYVPRNSGATTFYALAWDGQTINGSKVYSVPNGQYVIKLTVVKALGSEANPADVETWTSPVINIARP
jgi:hypothetical protein